MIKSPRLTWCLWLNRLERHTVDVDVVGSSPIRHPLKMNNETMKNEQSLVIVSLFIFHCVALVAQWIEHLTSDQVVVSSNLAEGACCQFL